MTYAITPKVELNFRVPDAPLIGPIKFAIGQCVEGYILVARSEVGICAIFLDDDPEGLCQQLHEAFPAHQVVEATAELRSDLAQVVAFVDKSAAEGIINLDIGGTAFQQRVWEALCGIPIGQTRTYAEVAQYIGAPEAVRAVAGACAANMLAIAIPCHRVVHSDGRISGYRWGVERKRALLEREHA
jgi:AraC family transcriptional regulator of adaptative response/methylated-DNA-[protein]-cysteine methyltransferase